MTDKIRILCIGEILWDALPDGLYLGGAPLNVCYHLNQMGLNSEMVSRVGKDRLGGEALQRIQKKGISTKNIQTDGQYETGFVNVDVAENGDPAYEIIEPVAWDFIELTSSLADKVKQSWGLVFGSLAQRNERSRDTIQKLWNHSGSNILDLNLRPPHVDETIVYDSLTVADIVKMNEAELYQIKEWFSLQGEDHQLVEAVAHTFSCPFVCVTKGADGAMLFQEDNWFEHEGYKAKAQDGVGAGDAFLAAMIYGIVTEIKGEKLLRYANAAGSYVAQKSGATPEYEIDDVRKIVSEISR